MKKVGIFYHWFAHYREPIIRELQNRLGEEFEFEFIADAVASEPAMEVLDSAEFKAILGSDTGFSRVRNINFAGFIWQVGAIWKAFSGKYDSVIFLGEFRILSSWFAILAAKLRGSRTYFWSHGVYGNESWLKLRIRLMFYRLADGMLLYGNRSRILMESMGFSQKQLHIVFNSLDYQKQIAMRDNVHGDKQSFRTKFFPNSPNDPVLIFIGRITKIKKLSLLIRVVQMLSERGQPVNLLVVGEGPELTSLTQLANQLEIQERVCFFGSCHDEEVLSAHLVHADICVSPGNVGLLAMHSLVYGTPVVTHGDLSNQMPEVEAIVEGRTGGFFDRADIDSLYDTLTKWLDIISKNPAKVQADCYEIIERFYKPSVQCEVLRAACSGHEAKLTPVELSE